LIIEGKSGEWAGKALVTVSDLYPYGSYENRKICGDYLSHAYAVLSYKGSFFIIEVIAKAYLLHYTTDFILS